MSEKIASEAISRRSMLSFLGLAASSLTILSSVLRPSDAEAYTYGMARRRDAARSSPDGALHTPRGSRYY